MNTNLSIFFLVFFCFLAGVVKSQRIEDEWVFYSSRQFVASVNNPQGGVMLTYSHIIPFSDNVTKFQLQVYRFTYGNSTDPR
jgi:hypothetical protein